MDHDDLDFTSLKPVTKTFKYESIEYTLGEITGGAMVEYDNAEDSTRIYNDQGKLSGFKDRANLGPLFVSLCLTQGGKPVPLSTIKAWPHRMVRKLYQTARTISDLDDRPGEIDLLLKALEGGGSPITAKALIKYVKSLPDKEYGLLKLACKPAAEELAKNE